MNENEENETPARPRTSRFKEHTNTTSSIHPPPDALWQDLGIEDMIEKFNEENAAPPTTSKGGSRKTTPIFGKPSASVAPPATTPAANEGTMGRFSRAFASVFGGFGSVLGKRKAGATDADRNAEREKQVLDERKQAADEAYQALKLAQEQGLMPTPKVFRRPVVFKEGGGNVATPVPRTPGTLYRSPSKKDLVKQKKLSKRVSDLEFKLASARKELNTVLHQELPPVPPLPSFVLPTPTSTRDTSQESPNLSDEAELSQDTHITTPSIPSQSTQPPKSPSIGKIIKKRKATISTSDDDNNDPTYKPIPTDSEGDIGMSEAEPSEAEHEQSSRSIKRVKSSSSGKRLTKRPSKKDLRRSEEVVRIVPDGKKVPEVPKIPKGVRGRKAKVRGEEGGRDDGYGGLEHEMF